METSGTGQPVSGNVVSFLQNTHNRHPIARPWGQDMGCLLWELWLIFCLSYCIDVCIMVFYCMCHIYILQCIITVLQCIYALLIRDELIFFVRNQFEINLNILIPHLYEVTMVTESILHLGSFIKMHFMAAIYSDLNMVTKMASVAGYNFQKSFLLKKQIYSNNISSGHKSV